MLHRLPIHRRSARLLSCAVGQLWGPASVRCPSRSCQSRRVPGKGADCLPPIIAALWARLMIESTPGRQRAAADAVAVQEGGIYSNPKLYDYAFSYRRFDEEVRFLQDAYQHHAPDQPLKTVLELGCGPAQHSIELAKGAGVPEVWGLDNSPDMVEYAKQKAAATGASVRFVREDMTDFHIQELAGRLDMALCLLGTFSHMLSNAQAAAAFGCVAKHLRPGGLFVLELAHPGDLFDGTLMLGDGGTEMWEVQRDDAELMVEWGSEMDGFDPGTQVLQRTVSISTMKEGKVQEHLLEDVMPYRQFTVQEIDLLARLSGLEVQDVLGDLQLGVGLRHEDAYRMVVVMKKV